MQVIVKGHHIHVNGHLKDTAVHKLEKLSRFFDRIQKLEIEFSHEKSRRAPAKHRVNVALTTPLGALRAHANATDPEAAIDSVVDKLERQIIRLKERVVRHGAAKGGIRAKATSPKLASAGSVSLESVKLNGSSPDMTGEEEAARFGPSSAT